MNTQMQNDVYKLEAVNYLAPDNAVALMAKDYVEARHALTGVQGAYLKVLVAHSQKALPDAVSATKEQMLEAVRFTHDRLYAIVLNAITTPDIAIDNSQPDHERQRRSLERNRRSNFARSAKSTLVAYIAAEGNLLRLKPGEVTKESLREFTATVVTPPTELDRANTIEKRLERTVRQLAEKNREEAIEFIDRLHTALMLIVARPLTQLTARRGELTLHPAH